ncbi:MAG: DUF58 domain-containing protein, partial [Gammaproteobacteria bacterium]|nr:DUF58 domain-containing protein [Gammaproteobacteria bacterium]
LPQGYRCPGARVVVLADPARAATISSARWAALAMHHEVVVMLLVDPLELAPPADALPFLSQGRRVLLDLRSAAVREHWRERFVAPLEALQSRLAARRIQVHVVATDDASDSWLSPLPTAVVA